MLFHLQTSYLVPRYNPIMRTQQYQGQGHRSWSNFQKMGKKLNNWPYLRCVFTYSLHTWYQDTTHKCASNDPSAYDVDQRSRSKVKVKISQKWVK